MALAQIYGLRIPAIDLDEEENHDVDKAGFDPNQPRVLLKDPGVVEDEVSDLSWQLFLIDENDNPVAPISCLLESVLETDRPAAKCGRSSGATPHR